MSRIDTTGFFNSLDYRVIGRDAIVSFSLANLFFLAVWRELIFADHADMYWMPGYTSASYLAVIANIALAGTIMTFFATMTRILARPSINVIARLVFVFSPLVFFEFLRVIIEIDENTVFFIQENMYISIPVGLVLVFLGFWLISYKLMTTSRILGFSLLVLAPFAVMTLSQAAWYALTTNAQQVEKLTTSQIPHSPRNGPRIIWIVFDELDYRLAFQDRPPGIHLPNFDSLVSQAIFSTNAMSHSRDTMEAIPSYLSGILVKEAKPISADRLDINRFDEPDNTFSSWSNYSSVFEDFHARGWRNAIAGYYFPYCRVFKESITSCVTNSIYTYSSTATNNLWKEVKSQIFGITPIANRVSAVNIYRNLTVNARNMAADSSTGFIYVHASVPHAPNIMNRQTDQLTWFQIGKEGYFGNLLLADRFLASIKSAMTDNGLWDEAVILVTADHEWRHSYQYDNKRVRKLPFILKMPGQKAPVILDHEFSPMLYSKKLLLEIADRKLTSPQMVVNWLTANTNVYQE
jgi:hypothetical protein